MLGGMKATGSDEPGSTLVAQAKAFFRLVRNSLIAVLGVIPEN